MFLEKSVMTTMTVQKHRLNILCKSLRKTWHVWPHRFGQAAPSAMHEAAWTPKGPTRPGAAEARMLDPCSRQRPAGEIWTQRLIQCSGNFFFEARSPKSAKSARHRLWKLKCHTALWETTVKGFPLLNLIGHCWLASCRHTVAYPAGPAPKHLKHFELITSLVFWKDDSGLCPWL